jgi:hypothetical protein
MDFACQIKDAQPLPPVDEFRQRGIDRFLLGFESAKPDRLLDQTIIEL